MADEPEEAADITSICGGLNINIGTLNQRTVKSMLISAETANKMNIPVLLDPVGAGASKLRTQTAKRLVENVKFSVIRGNVSEIKEIAGYNGAVKGVDADEKDKVTEDSLDKIINTAKELSKKTGAVIAITGAIDVVADAEKAFCIYNGNAMMSTVTGTGCQLSALITSFIAANPHEHLKATAAAVCAMGLCGEQAFERLSDSDGNASYRNYIIDAIYNLTEKELEGGAKYEMR